MPLTVRYGYTMTIFLLLVIGFNLFLSFTPPFEIVRLIYLLFVGVLIVVLVLMRLRPRPYFMVESKMLTLYGVGGFLNSKFPYESLASLRLERRRLTGTLLTYQKDGTWRGISVVKWVAHPQDWAALEALLAQQQ